MSFVTFVVKKLLLFKTFVIFVNFVVKVLSFLPFVSFVVKMLFALNLGGKTLSVLTSQPMARRNPKIHIRPLTKIRSGYRDHA